MAERKSELPIGKNAARWIVLILVSATLFSAYYFVEVITPLRPLLESHYRWDEFSFSLFSYSKYFLILIGFLLLAGLIIDKVGIRLSGIISVILMVVGASLILFAFSPKFNEGSFLFNFLSNTWKNTPPSLIIACFGYSIFGLGVESTTITAILSLVKWFRNKELGLAIGILISVSRFGGAFAFLLSADFAGFREVFGLPHGNLMNPVYFGNSLLFIGLLSFLTFALIDKNIEVQVMNDAEKSNEIISKINDLMRFFKNRGLIFLSAIFVLMYSFFSIFTSNIITSQNLQQTVGNDSQSFYGVILLGIIILSPLSGILYDKKININYLFFISALLLILALILLLIGSSFAVMTIAICFIVLSFTIVVTSILSHLSKLIPENGFGYAYATLFWLQTIGLVIFSAIL